MLHKAERSSIKNITTKHYLIICSVQMGRRILTAQKRQPSHLRSPVVDEEMTKPVADFPWQGVHSVSTLQYM